MNWLTRHRYKLLVSLALACVFVWLMRVGDLPILPSTQALAGFDWSSLLAYNLIWSLVHVLRAWRWKYLLSPIAEVPMRKLLLTSFIGFAAIVILPMRAGEIVRPALVREEGKLSGWSATGTVGAERIIDGLILSLMLLFGLLASTPLDPLPERIGNLPISPRLVPQAAYFALLLFACAFVTMGFFYFAREWTRGWVERLVGLVSARLASWLAERIERVTAGLSFLPSARHTVPFILATTIYWLLNAAAAQWLGRGCGLSQMNFAQACVLTGVLALGIMVPNAPGFFGAFQFSAYAALSLFFVEQQLFSDGSLMVFFLFVSQNAIMIAFALVAAAMMHTSMSAALDTDERSFEDGAANGDGATNLSESRHIR